MNSIVLFLLVSSGIVGCAAKCWSNGNKKTQAQWWQDGDEIERGSYYYECLNSVLVVRGCVVNGTRLQIGRTTRTAKKELECARDPNNNNYLYMKEVACIDTNGYRRAVNEQWNIGDSWFTCEVQNFYNRPYLTKKLGGCVFEGRRVKRGDNIEKPNGWYQCKRSFNGTKVALMGCIKEGRRMMIRTKTFDKNYGYECTSKDGQPVVSAIHCVHNGRNLNSGDRYFMDGTVYMCDILWNQETKTTAQNHTVVGCLETDTNGYSSRERTLGCQWKDETGECDYEYRCNYMGKTDPLGCLVKSSGEVFLYIPSQSYTIYSFPGRDDVGYGCKLDRGRLELVQFAPKEISWKAAGLVYTTPIGK